MVIYPDIQATPDCPTIKFNQPRDQVDLEKEIPRILHAQGWGCGTLFNIMFLNHEKTKLLACGRFVVSEEIETIQTNDANPYQPMTRTVFSRAAVQIGDWWPSEIKPDVIDITYVEDAQVVTERSLETLRNSMEPKRRGRPPKAAESSRVE